MNTAESTTRRSSGPPPRVRGWRLRTWHVLVLWTLLMAPLTFWGLPSSETDRLLFAGEPAWAAERYQVADALERRRARFAGADTDLDPLPVTDRIIDLTSDEAQRAAILRRYRLYSRQPDEMITFMALQRMSPRELDFDPRMVQYGGGYVYLIGAALGVTTLLGLTHLSGDAGVYLTDPDLFARFYVVSRFVSLIFGALTLVAVAKLGRRAAGRTAGWIAVLCVACSPVFVVGTLEAKPHLPSACMLLWTIIAALDFCKAGRRRDAVRMGLSAGYAFGLVLTGLAAALVWPVLFVARTSERWSAMRHLILGGFVAVAVYLVTNPYVPYNVLFNRQSLADNIGNSMAMYSVGRFGEGLVRVVELLVESCGVAVVVTGLAGFALLLRKNPAQITIAALAGAAMLLICVALGAGKPAEFARFLLLPAILLCVATSWVLTTLAARKAALGIAATLVVLALMRTPVYLWSFAVDAGLELESRYLAACYLSEHTSANETIGVVQVPAPYAVPPLGFARRRVQLLPNDEPESLDPRDLPAWLVLTADDAGSQRTSWWRIYYELSVRFPSEGAWLSRIAWANKPVFVYRRRIEQNAGRKRAAQTAGPGRSFALTVRNAVTVPAPQY